MPFLFPPLLQFCRFCILPFELLEHGKHKYFIFCTETSLHFFLANTSKVSDRIHPKVSPFVHHHFNPCYKCSLSKSTEHWTIGVLWPLFDSDHHSLSHSHIFAFESLGNTIYLFSLCH